MSASKQHSLLELASALRECLEHGATVRVEGLGTFQSGGDTGFTFVPSSGPRVFIAYVEEELETAREIFRGLAAAGFSPWLDKKKLLPGQNWPRAIEAAIQSSDYFIACFSKHANGKRGHFNSELRFALECARRVPLEEIFFIPVRLDDCTMPANVASRLQYVDLFPDLHAGIQGIIAAIAEQEHLRKRGSLRRRG